MTSKITREASAWKVLTKTKARRGFAMIFVHVGLHCRGLGLDEVGERACRKLAGSSQSRGGGVDSGSVPTWASPTCFVLK